MCTHETQSASISGEAPPSVMRARLVLGIILVAMTAALAYGVEPLWPYLLDEHRRIRPWQWLFLWMGDLAPLVWFVAFIVPPPRIAAVGEPSARRAGAAATGHPGVRAEHGSGGRCPRWAQRATPLRRLPLVRHCLDCPCGGRRSPAGPRGGRLSLLRPGPLPPRGEPRPRREHPSLGEEHGPAAAPD
jgi:hypothetical protein